MEGSARSLCSRRAAFQRVAPLSAPFLLSGLSARTHLMRLSEGEVVRGGVRWCC